MHVYTIQLQLAIGLHLKYVYVLLIYKRTYSTHSQLKIYRLFSALSLSLSHSLSPSLSLFLSLTSYCMLLLLSLVAWVDLDLGHCPELRHAVAYTYIYSDWYTRSLSH